MNDHLHLIVGCSGLRLALTCRVLVGPAIIKLGLPAHWVVL